MVFFLAVLPTLILATYGQLVSKWRVSKMMEMQEEAPTVLERLFSYITDPFIISAYAFTFFSSIMWFLVLEKYPVSIAFPAYIGLLFVTVLLGSTILLHEPISLQHIIGVVLILAGVIVISLVQTSA